MLSLTAPLLLSSCFLPAAGPDAVEVAAGGESVVPHVVVPLSKGVVDVLATHEPSGLAGEFKDKKPPSTIRIGVGDVVAVSIFESSSGGLFIPPEASVRPGNFVTLPDQIVDNKGNITVPYAGVVPAAGRTNVEVQQAIINRIAQRAIEPQVMVTLAQQRSNLVSVLGEVNTPVRYPAAYAGARDRITDALTRAGGIKGGGHEIWVALERNRHRATVPFENLISNPANNIYLQPGDQIYVYRDPQKFIAFGAFGEQGIFPFDSWRISLAEAVGRARGLVDLQAEPGSVFLYRQEPRKVAEALGVDLAQFPNQNLVPVIFSVSFRDPGGYFLATQLQMRNRDVIFVANAPSVQVAKFLAVLAPTAASAASAASVGFYASTTP